MTDIQMIFDALNSEKGVCVTNSDEAVDAIYDLIQKRNDVIDDLKEIVINGNNADLEIYKRYGLEDYGFRLMDPCNWMEGSQPKINEEKLLSEIAKTFQNLSGKQKPTFGYPPILDMGQSWIADRKDIPHGLGSSVMCYPMPYKSDPIWRNPDPDKVPSEKKDWESDHTKFDKIRTDKFNKIKRLLGK